MSWQPLSRLSRSGKVRDLLGAVPVDRPSIARFVAGETAREAVEVATALTDAGVLVGIEWLVAPAMSAEEADAIATGYLDLFEALRSSSVSADITLNAAALGLRLAPPGEKLALENARAICLAATMASSTVSVPASDPHSLNLARELRRDFPDAGLIVHAAAIGAEADVAEFADARVRLVSGGLDGSDRVAGDRLVVDKVFVRCTQLLMAGSGRPAIATHDGRLVRIAADLARRAGREPGSYEFVLPYGVRADEARRLVEVGETVRVVVPFGMEWPPYVAMRLAEHPANLASSVGALGRSLLPRRKAGS